MCSKTGVVPLPHMTIVSSDMEVRPINGQPQLLMGNQGKGKASEGKKRGKKLNYI